MPPTTPEGCTWSASGSPARSALGGGRNPLCLHERARPGEATWVWAAAKFPARSTSPRRAHPGADP
eukprot:1391775-Alexandrium_andersonii.AAC.1